MIDKQHLGPAEGRDETVHNRLDRNYSELLQELRISETGVQVLFGFLLAIAFQQRFEQIDTFQRTVYVTTLLCCALSVGLLVAPVAFHRIVFRRGMKQELVAAASVFVMAGTSFMLVSIVGGVLLILDVAVNRPFALIAGGLLGALFLGLWVGLPLARLRRNHRSLSRSGTRADD